jgi:hypothetical protein
VKRYEGSCVGGNWDRTLTVILSQLGSVFQLRGMHLEFRHPEYRTPIVTSAIREIRECARLSQREIAARV